MANTNKIEILELSTKEIEQRYKVHRNEESWKTIPVKMIPGFLVLLYFTLSDFYLTYRTDFFPTRIISLLLCIIILFFRFFLSVYAKKGMFFLYNAFLISITFMMYGILYLSVNTSDFVTSSEGALFVLALAGFELRGKFFVVAGALTIPLFLFILASTLKYDGFLEHYNITLSHYVAITLLGMAISRIQENRLFKNFETSLYLEEERLKTELLNQNLININEEILQQKEIVDGQHEAIHKVNTKLTDSIIYAKRIQAALLPSKEVIERAFADVMVIFKPKDIVSGDFYWGTKIKKCTLFAVADCTGHGVPGAMMSMLAIAFLNETVRRLDVQSVDIALNELRNKIISSLHQTANYKSLKDGLDICLCSYNKEEGILYISSARLNAVLIRNGILELIRGDKMPISASYKMHDFNLHQFRVQPGDRLILFTDGYSDQFGGLHGKPFKRKNFIRIIEQNKATSLGNLKAMLEKELHDWRNASGIQQDQIDDITIVGVEF